MALLTAFMRIFYSIDEWTVIFGVLGLEPAHFPQYFLWFLGGILTYQNQWISQITKKQGRTCICIAVATSSIIYVQNIFPKILINNIYKYFSIYETIMSVTIIIALIYILKNYLDSQNRFIEKLSNNAFFIYVIHNMYVILFQVIFCYIAINSLIKVIIITFVVIICSVLTAIWVKKLHTFIVKIYKQKSKEKVSKKL